MLPKTAILVVLVNATDGWTRNANIDWTMKGTPHFEGGIKVQIH